MLDNSPCSPNFNFFSLSKKMMCSYLVILIVLIDWLYILQLNVRNKSAAVECFMRTEIFLEGCCYLFSR